VQRLIEWIVCAALCEASIAPFAAAQQASPAAIFTVEQFQVGHAIYTRVCSACHGADLEGAGDAPALAGGTFLLKWRLKMASELVGEILQNMPPSDPGSLSESAALNATAYILQHNGASAGQQALTTSATTPIGATLGAAANRQTEQRPPRSDEGGGQRANASMVLGAGTAAGTSRGGATNARGVRITGEVRNYIPVSAEILKNPPPEDWLIFGRTYQRHSYSPLNQITRDNVKNLQLKWVWAMNDSGANQTTPIIHNGVMYLASPSNIVQALNARNGDLIWETRVGPDQAPGYGGIRSIAIAEDKVLLPTSDAHMVALDARSGKILWDTPASDKPHPSTSGDIVIGDKVLMGLTGCAHFDGEGCYISAFDIHTGQRAWRFYTIPREGQPGSDTWGNLPMNNRAGAETWLAGSYDPELNITYWGVAQSKPWNFLSRRLTPFDKTLYANSTVALDPDTGKLIWYFQHAPGESFDLDEVFERVLIDVGDQKWSLSAGKAADRFGIQC
jgi:alcohol dehydrogenase (cytochrome c)